MKKRKMHSEFVQQGFTIIELLIASLIFSVILMLVTFGVLQVTRTYYKGVTSAQTQQAARSIIDKITQDIQFNGGVVTGLPNSTVPFTSHAFCVGDNQYSYILGQELKDGSNGNHGLVVNNQSGCNVAMAQDLTQNSVTGVEYLQPNMRLSNLAVSQDSTNSSLYTVEVRVVYGDDDLLCSASSNNCNSTSTVSSGELGSPDLICKNYSTGTQFCAVADLKTTIQKRVN